MTKFCPKCHQEFDAVLLDGVCPSCLLRATSLAEVDESTLKSVGDGIGNDLVLGKIGEYELLSEIGRGGMGVVYRAVQSSLGRVVALKMIQDSAISDEAIKRFLNEAKAAADLQHPNIVTVYECGVYSGKGPYTGRHYISMELIEGLTLADIIAKGPIPVRRAVGYILQVVRALEYVHSRGILHRDVKPGNILIDCFGTPRITDFGAAKDLNRRSGFTVNTIALGTPCYMPPEQATGSTEIDCRADIYSIGATLYHLLAGKPPFYDATELVTRQQIISQDPIPIRKINGSLSKDLDTICQKCLEKLPKNRYQTMADLAADLHAFLNHTPIKARPASLQTKIVKLCQRKPVVTALSVSLVIVVFLAVVLISIKWQQASKSGALATTEWKRAEQLAAESQNRLERLYLTSGLQFWRANNPLASLNWFAESLRIHEQGSNVDTIGRMRLDSLIYTCPQLVKVWFPSETNDTPQVDTNNSIVPNSNGTWTLTFKIANIIMPDNEIPSVGFSRNGQFVLAYQDGLTARVKDSITGVPISRHLNKLSPRSRAWISDTGRFVAATCADLDVRLFDTKTTNEFLLPFENAYEFQSAQFSPDEKLLVTQDRNFKVRIWNTSDGQEAVKVPDAFWANDTLSFSSNSSCFILSSIVEEQKMTNRVITPAKYLPRIYSAVTGRQLDPSINGPFAKNDQFFTKMAFTPDDTSIWAIGGGCLYIWDAKTGKQIGSTRQLQGAHIADISPDGSNILTAAGYSGYIWSVYEDVDPVQLSFESQVRSVAFSPDGQLFLTTHLDGGIRFWKRDGKPASFPVLYHPGDIAFATFLPDCRHVLTAGKDTLVKIWQLPSGPVIDRQRLIGQVPQFVSNRFWGAQIGTCEYKGQRIIEKYTGLNLYEFGKPEPIATLEITNSIKFAACDPHGKRLVIAYHASGVSGFRGILEVWDVRLRQRIKSIQCDNLVTPFRINQIDSNCSHFIAHRFPDIVMVDLNASTPDWWMPLVRTNTDPNIHRGGINLNLKNIAINPGGTLVASASTENLSVWDVESRRPLFSRGCFNSRKFEPYHELTFTPDGGKLLAFIGNIKPEGEPKCVLLNAKTGELLWEIPWDWKFCQMHNVAFSTDGLIALPTAGDKFRMFDLESGKPISPLIDCGAGIRQLEFSPDNKLLVVLEWNGNIKTFDSRTGDMVIRDLQVLKPLSLAETMMNNLDSPFKIFGSNIFIISPQDICRYKMTINTNAANDLVEIANALSGMKINSTGDVDELSKEEVQNLWNKVRLESFFGTSKTSDISVAASHAHQADVCLIARNIFGAMYHIKIASTLDRTNIQYLSKLEVLRNLARKQQPANNPFRAFDTPLNIPSRE